MARNITLKCHTCGHQWIVDLDKERPERTIYRGDLSALRYPKFHPSYMDESRQKMPSGEPERIASYRFACPVDGSYVVVEEPIKE